MESDLYKFKKINSRDWKNRYVISRKPSPAYLAAEKVDWTAIRQDMLTDKQICEATGSPLEFVLKDISTIRYELDRLTKWHESAMEIVCS